MCVNTNGFSTFFLSCLIHVHNLLLFLSPSLYSIHVYVFTHVSPVEWVCSCVVFECDHNWHEKDKWCWWQIQFSTFSWARNEWKCTTLNQLISHCSNCNAKKKYSYVQLSNSFWCVFFSNDNGYNQYLFHSTNLCICTSRKWTIG